MVTHNFVTYNFVTQLCHMQLCHIQLGNIYLGFLECVALGDICRRFTWQAWRLVTSAVVLRGRRGAYATGLAASGDALSPAVAPRYVA